MRTIQITVAVPDDARWMTTDGRGRLLFYERRPWIASLYSGDAWDEGALPIAWFDTNIPCPTWRESLVELKPENENE